MILGRETRNNVQWLIGSLNDGHKLKISPLWLHHPLRTLQSGGFRSGMTIWDILVYTHTYTKSLSWNAFLQMARGKLERSMICVRVVTSSV